ncbi:C_GCAxxG_C_C family protein [Serpentinicella alkaliphila]|nr:C_GCAxxG_C_C family protein [Serpentinicella alkaliphila]
MKEAEEKSKNYFREGLNCAECVMRSFMDMHDINLPDEIIALSTGFGGGLGHTKNTCGAITGAVLALGTIKGRSNPFALETPSERVKELKGVYEDFGKMVIEIENEYGTLICSELSDPYGDFEGKIRKKNCQQIIGYCAAMCTKYAVE